MVGLRLDRTSRAARWFGEAMIETAHAGATSWRTVPFGSRSFRLGSGGSDELSALIDGAFLHHDRHEGDLTLAIMQQLNSPPLPPTLWARPWIESRTEVPARVSYPYRILFDQVVGVVYVFDQSSGRSTVWVRQRSEVDLRSFITPFRVLLSWLGNPLGIEVIHASAVVVDGHGVAFSGPSGSGKSTLALAVGTNGHGIIADDCIVVEGTTAHAVYSRAKVDDRAQTMLGIADSDLEQLDGAPRAKKILALESLGSGFRRSAPIDIVMSPVVASSPAWYPIGPSLMSQILISDSLRETMGGGVANRLRLARLVTDRPSYRVMLGPSMRDNVEMLQDLVSQSAASER